MGRRDRGPRASNEYGDEDDVFDGRWTAFFVDVTWQQQPTAGQAWQQATAKPRAGPQQQPGQERTQHHYGTPARNGALDAARKPGLT